jgi:hypothetical protein
VRCSRLGAVARNRNNKSRTVCFSAQLRLPFSGHRATTTLKSCMLSRLHLKPLPDWAPPRQTGRTTLKIVCLYQQISRRLLSPGRHGQKYIHTYMHSYNSTHINTYIDTYINERIHTFIHTYNPKYTRESIHTCTPTHAHPHMHTYRHTERHTHIHTDMHTYTYTYTYTYKHTYTQLHT